MRASCKIAQLCAVAALIGGCAANNDDTGGGASGSGTGGSAAPAASMMTTGTGGATTGPNPGSGTGNPAMQTGSGGMPGTGTSQGSGGSGSAGTGQAGDGADHGSGGATETNPDGGAPTDGGDTTEPTHEDLGMGDGKDVITIGDSWMQLYVAGIEQSLDKASGQMYRHYAVPGTLVLDEVIPNQYESAKMANPDIKTVVMTGGGNDILTSSCADEACNPIVDMVSDRLTKLQQEAGKDGVQDIVIIGYTYPDQMDKRESLDYSRMLSKTFCTLDTMPRCHYLDSTTLDITLRDGIHPDDAGYDLIGATVWQMMQDAGIRR